MTFQAQFDAPLLTPKKEEEELLEKQQEDSLVARMKMFVQLRQDLERVRNLCYMVSKREKMKKQFYKDREAVFVAMNKILTNSKLHLGQREVNRIVEMYHFNSIYDTNVLENVQIPPEIGENEEDINEEEDSVMQDPPQKPAKLKLEFSTDPVDLKSLKHVNSPEKSLKTPTRRKWSIHKRSRRASEMLQELSDDGDTGLSDVESLCSEPRLKAEPRSLRSQKSPGSSLCGEEDAVDCHKKTQSQKTQEKDYVEDLKISQVKFKQRSRRESFTKAERELRKATKSDSSEDLCVPDMLISSKSNIVSEKVKAEVNGYLQNAKLVIPDKIKSRIHRGLVRNRAQIANIASGYVQTSLDTFFNSTLGKNSPLLRSPNTRSPNTRPSTPKSPVSRVLNEISPCRTRHGSSNSIYRSQSNSPKRTKAIPEGITNSVGKNIIDVLPRETRSVRRRIDNVFDVFDMDFGHKSSGENSPGSTEQSVRQPRSMSPASLNSDLVDVENIYESDNTLKRITRSQGLDSAENSRDSFTSSRSGIS